MGKRNKVTTRDIAKALNVSQSTVSMILSDNKNVSFKEETVKLVKKTAKQMGYKKPEVKKRYSNTKNTIVVICSNLSNSYYSMVVSSIIEQASMTKTQILTISTLRKDELEKHLFNGCGFGPPLPFTATSSWTWVGHPVSGLLTLTNSPC